MLRRTLWTLVMLSLSAATLCQGQAPVVNSQQQLWQGFHSACGTMVKHEGMYEFIVGDGVTCVTNVGVDLVTFLVKSAPTPKLYLFVPMDHLIIELAQ
jgi:hypothetical protein